MASFWDSTFQLSLTLVAFYTTSTKHFFLLSNIPTHSYSSEHIWEQNVGVQYLIQAYLRPEESNYQPFRATATPCDIMGGIFLAWCVPIGLVWIRASSPPLGYF